MSQKHSGSSQALKKLCSDTADLAKTLALAKADDDSVTGESLLQALQTVAQGLGNWSKSPEFHGVVRTSNLLPLMVDVLITIQEAGKSFEDTEGTISYMILAILLNTTNWSVEICRIFSQQEKYFSVFYPKHLSEQDAQKLCEQDGLAYQSVYYTIGTVFNSYFKNDSEIFTRLTEHELVDSTKPYLQCKDATLSTAALNLIAFAVDEKKSDIFLGAKKNMEFLIENLKVALSQKDRNWRGYDALESAKCIKRLALNDSNKDMLIELNLLPVVQQMLSSSNNEDVSEGIEILFTLSFSKKYVPRIRSEFKEVIAKLQASEKWRDSKQLQGLAFQLQEQTARPASAAGKAAASSAAASAKKPRKIMISYNHGSRPQVERLFQKLVEAQFEVWVDFKDMKSGSVYQAMADGIESSSVVLLCISRLYNESSNCRLEVEYAHESSKKLIPLLMEPKYRPTGWLGLLTRAELRYDFTETKCSFDEKFVELLSALHSHLDGSRATSATGGERRGHSLPSTAPILPPIAAPSRQHLQLSQAPSTTVRSWDSARVSAWCQEKQLPDSVKARGLSGFELQFLVNSLHRSPEYFGRLMDTHFGLTSLLDLATLVAALEDLMMN